MRSVCSAAILPDCRAIRYETYGICLLSFYRPAASPWPHSLGEPFPTNIRACAVIVFVRLE
jgi:hypothetical protein